MKGNIFTALTLGVVPCLLSPAVASSACNFKTFLALRERWAADDEPCQQKLTFDLWMVMMAEGSAADPDAQHVLAECTNVPAVNAVELSIDEGWEYAPANENCGTVVDQSKSAAAFACKNAADLEAMCGDTGISRATRITASHSGSTQRNPNIRGATKPKRHLQATTSEAGIAHEVDVLIAGLQELGCANTMGDGQTLCVMSDSFNGLGNAAELQESGDLPEVEVVKEFPVAFDLPSDEGSAMLELAYDIAPNAVYKFNTATLGLEIFAQDITALSTTHDCDVIVDDIGYSNDPAFRDGLLPEAIDSAVEDEGIVYFTAAGNAGPGVRFTFNLECTDVFFGEDIAPCTAGVGTHVFDDTTDGISRYLIGYESIIADQPVLLQWDDDVGAADLMIMALWSIQEDELVFQEFSAHGSPANAFAALFPSPSGQYYVSVHMLSDRADTALEMQLTGLQFSAGKFQGASDSSIYGKSCATKGMSIAAIDHEDANGGAGGAFSDPELSSVESFSSRGGCSVRNDAGVLEERMKPVTTAADNLSTSTPGFGAFSGTSAAAPVAAAIATLIRAACAPEKVVGFDEMMEMLTNDAYTIDYPGDEDATGNMWGAEAGYGIMSGAQMLDWVATNCALACPGNVVPVLTPSPTEDVIPVTTAPTLPPTPAPTSIIPVTTAPVSAQTPAPTDDVVQVTTAPVPAPTPAPTGDIIQVTTAPVPVPTPAPTGDIVQVTTTPILVPTPAPIDVVQVTAAPVPVPTPVPTGGIVQVTTAPALVATPAPIDVVQVTTAPVPAPTSAPVDDGVVEAGTTTTVTVTATGYDSRPSDEQGCGMDGCIPELTRDGILADEESRWSCKENVVLPGFDNCELEFEFGEPQDIATIQVAFWKGDARSRRLKVKVNGSTFDSFESTPDSEYTSYGIGADDVKRLTLESIGLDKDEWISILEVRFLVTA